MNKKSVCLILDEAHFNKLLELQKISKKGYSKTIMDIIDIMLPDDLYNTFKKI